MRVNCKSNFTELNTCEPRAGRFGKSGRAAGTVRARLPAKPLISVSGREPRAGNSEIGGPGAGMVRARLPAKPLISVSGREPRTGNSEMGGPGAGTVRARFPAKPLISVPRREPRTARFGNGGPGPRPVCSPPPAKPYVFVPGSKFFTQLPAGMHGFAGARADWFAPRSSLSQFLRFGEQILHTTSGRKARFRRRSGRPAFSVSVLLVLDRKKQCATFLSTSHTASL